MESPAVPRKLSAKFKSDFAYVTVKDRLPIILTKLIDNLVQIRSNEPDEKHSDLKKIIGKLSKFRNTLMTDKEIINLEDNFSDVDIWNSYRSSQFNGSNPPSFFTSSWLYAETYFYRKIYELFQLSNFYQNYDYFAIQKQNAWTTSMSAAIVLAKYLLFTISLDYTDENYIYEHFKEFFQIALWGNKCDLSISAGGENSQTSDPISQLSELKKYILHNCEESLWKYICDIKLQQKNRRIDIIIDNAGFELFSDLCFAEYLVYIGAADKIYFHPKSFPWFVSDVLETDFDWLLKQMSISDSKELKELSKLWYERLKKGSWVIANEAFWTYPHSYWEMESVDVKLYANLASSHLLIFKGDLHYRKLCRDSNWNILTNFEVALGPFHPAPICALRTLKSDVLVGLSVEEAEQCDMKSKDKWMFDGSRAVSQFCQKITLPFL